MEATSSAVDQVVAEGVTPEAPAAEVVVIEETVVEAAEAEMPEPAVEAVAEAPKPAKPPRVCSKCGHPSGNSVGKIRFGRIVEAKGEDGSKRRYEIAALCDGCAEAEKHLPPEERKPVFKIGYLISQIDEMNAQAEAFDAARGYWERVIQGIETPEVRKTLEGKLACGVPGCWCCKDNLAAVEHFVVLKKDGVPVIVGGCPFQAAALAKCGADQKFFVTRSYKLAAERVASEVAKAKAFETAKEFWIAVDAGEAVVEVRVEETADGDPVYRCGVPDCGCRSHGDKPVEHKLVLDGQAEMPIGGICRYQFAALKQSGAKIFASSNDDGMGLARCAKHRRWLLSRADNAARAVQGRPPRPQDFDRPGMGLRKKTEPDREARDKRRDERRAKLAAAVGNTKFGTGRRHKGGQKGGNGGNNKKR
jgi:hypothetical protein